MIPDPKLQIAFAASLALFRESYLQDALLETVGDLDIPTLDAELAQTVSKKGLSLLAARGIRGELMFPVPLVLRANPRLVGYYRLLYGYSQKEFFRSECAGSYRSAELSGRLAKAADASLPVFCKAMAKAGAMLLSSIHAGAVTTALLDDLTLLTLGPQLRGGANVAAGTAGIVAVFSVIKSIVENAVETSTPNRIELRNAAKRTVLIEFAPDPDIIIREHLNSGAYRQIISIEVKAGRDFSNIHNRIGEAEKSHQKARKEGYTECWTVVNVDNIDLKTAKTESPSTDRFYRISDLVAATGADFNDFRDRLTSLTGVAS